MSELYKPDQSGEDIPVAAETNSAEQFRPIELSVLEQQYAAVLFPAESIQDLDLVNNSEAQTQLIENRIADLATVCHWVPRPADSYLASDRPAQPPLFKSLQCTSELSDDRVAELQSLGMVHVKHTIGKDRAGQELQRYTEMVDWYQEQQQARQECLDILDQMKATLEDDLNALVGLFGTIKSRDGGVIHSDTAVELAYETLLGRPPNRKDDTVYSSAALDKLLDDYRGNIEIASDQSNFTELVTKLRNHQQAIEKFKQLQDPQDATFAQQRDALQNIINEYDGKSGYSSLADKVEGFTQDVVGYKNSYITGVRIADRVPDGLNRRSSNTPQLSRDSAEEGLQIISGQVKNQLEASEKYINLVIDRARIEHDVLHVHSTEGKYRSVDDAARHLESEKTERAKQADKARELLSRKPDRFVQSSVPVTLLSYHSRQDSLFVPITIEQPTTEREQLLRLRQEKEKLTKEIAEVNKQIETRDKWGKVGRWARRIELVAKSIESDEKLQDWRTGRINALELVDAKIKETEERITRVEQQIVEESSVNYDWETECLRAFWTTKNPLGQSMQQTEVAGTKEDTFLSWKEIASNDNLLAGRTVSPDGMLKLQKMIEEYLHQVANWGLAPDEQSVLDRYNDVIARINQGHASAVPQYIADAPFDLSQTYNQALQVVLQQLPAQSEWSVETGSGAEEQKPTDLANAYIQIVNQG